ncbi:hypothetical protein TRVL_05872 [Trypanosoma vivax]|nr:hypothetical protein TRVL_05872 [Trypanosoma vivax]
MKKYATANKQGRLKEWAAQSRGCMSNQLTQFATIERKQDTLTKPGKTRLLHLKRLRFGCASGVTTPDHCTFGRRSVQLNASGKLTAPRTSSIPLPSTGTRSHDNSDKSLPSRRILHSHSVATLPLIPLPTHHIPHIPHYFETSPVDVAVSHSLTSNGSATAPKRQLTKLSHFSNQSLSNTGQGSTLIHSPVVKPHCSDQWAFVQCSEVAHQTTGI